MQITRAGEKGFVMARAAGSDLVEVDFEDLKIQGSTHTVGHAFPHESRLSFTPPLRGLFV